MKYFLYPNHITPNPDDCVAKVTQQPTIDYIELIKRATRRGLSLTDTEVISVINELTYTINDALNSGYAVDTPFARFRPSIGGIFSSKDDIFDPNRHYIKINCLPGREIGIDQNQIALEKIKHVSASPYIESIFDYSTQKENLIITPGGAAEISGELLKIDVTDPLQGLFFIRNGSTAKVQIMMRNLPSELIFNIPALTAGDYQLEIRNKGNVKDLSLRTFLFSQLLTVK